mmetsp:Transcript_23465/g.46249  ORF Transcript_23465/g.46249 Transcript_23465/m.46249 type:complete len:208 (-) Transcript_23465:202-825(-)
MMKKLELQHKLNQVFAVDDETERNNYARKLYDESLARLNVVLKKKGIYRVSMDPNFCNVTEVVKAAGKPGFPYQFRMVVLAPGKPPKLSNYDHLPETHLKVIPILEKDLGSLAQAKEEEHKQQQLKEVLSGLNDPRVKFNDVSDWEQRFGELVPSQTKVQEDRERAEKEKREREKAQLDMDAGEEDPHPELTFQQMLEACKKEVGSL